MTILEVVVVIAIASLLFLLVLPALEGARESARRTACASNLRQVANAASQFEAVHRRLPMQSTVMRVNGQLKPSVSVHRQLLSYLDRNDVALRVDPNDLGVYRPDLSLELLSPRNRELLNQSIPVFLCPSDSAVSGGTNYRVNAGYGPGVFPPDWKPHWPGGRDPGNSAGTFPFRHGVALSEIRDGISYTALFSERVMGDGHASQYDTWRDVFDTGEFQNRRAESTRTHCTTLGRVDSPHSSFSGHTWLYGGFRTTSYNHLLPPNSMIPDCAQGANTAGSGGDGAHSARSFHAGGVNLATADSAVRFVSSDIDLLIWRALSTRAGRDAVD